MAYFLVFPTCCGSSGVEGRDKFGVSGLPELLSGVGWSSLWLLPSDWVSDEFCLSEINSKKLFNPRYNIL